MALISGPTVEAAISDDHSDLAKLVATEKDDAKLIAEIFLRVLNRPATAKEIELGLAELRQLPAAHKQLGAQLAAVEKKSAAARVPLEQQRQKAIADAGQALAAYEKQIAPHLADQKRGRAQQIVAAAAALHEAETTLPRRMAAWEQVAKKETAWTPLVASSLTSSNGAKLTQEADRAVFVAGPNGKAEYVFVAANTLPGVTAFRLEALSDKRLPSKGPGRAPNGNFVVSHFVVEWRPLSATQKNVAVAFQSAEADFSQGGYEVQTAIEGSPDRGWAIVPRTGQSHTAVFQLRDPVAAPGVFAIHLAQNFPDGQHTLGRFRISVTNAPRPVSIGQPERIAQILAVPGGKRTARQKADLLAHYRRIDPEFKQRSAALAEARKPLPVDPKLAELRRARAEAERPLPPDERLVMLRRDMELSTRQLEKRRLTCAQDLAWALINSPAFLFNH
jgi:hypothetical protein